MGIITPNGIVGIVNKVSKITQQSTDIKHEKSDQCKKKKTDHFGLLVWEKIRDPQHAHLIDIPRHVSAKRYYCTVEIDYIPRRNPNWI